MSSRGKLLLDLIRKKNNEKAEQSLEQKQKYAEDRFVDKKAEMLDLQNFFEMGPNLTPAVQLVDPVLLRDEFKNFSDQNFDTVLTPLATVNPNVYAPALTFFQNTTSNSASNFTFLQNATSNSVPDNVSEAATFTISEPTFFHKVLMPQDASVGLNEYVNVHPTSITSLLSNSNPVSEFILSESPAQNSSSQASISEFILPESAAQNSFSQAPVSEFILPESAAQNSSSQALPEFVSSIDPDNPVKLCIRRTSNRFLDSSNNSALVDNSLRFYSSNDESDSDSEYEPQISQSQKKSSMSFSENSSSLDEREETNSPPASAASCYNDSEDVTPKKTRKRRAKPHKWSDKKAKIRRNMGQSYISRSKSKKKVQGKKLRPPSCEDKCKLRCIEKITEHQRQKIFKSFWALGDVCKQRCFIAANLQNIQPTRVSSLPRQRKLNQAYHFEVEGSPIRVCKAFFCDTLDITNRVIQTVLAKKSISPSCLRTDFRGKHKNQTRIPDEVKQGVRDHIDSIPRIESHYLRAQTAREFIDGGRSISDIHRDYLEDCRKADQPSANFQMYSKIFNEEYNLGFFVPKKDQCELCVAFENAEGDEKEKLVEKYETHQNEKTLSRSEKDQDKAKINENFLVAVYDLQAVLPVPRGDVSVFYYKSKLNSYNFTISQLQSDKTHCYLWHEGEGNRGAEEIASCVFKFIETTVKERAEEDNSDDFDIVFYSDNCCGQQKNKFMVALYMFALKKFEKINSISHKYLITGHTQNEGDSVHSTIEKQIKRSLRSGPIYVPSQYAELIKSAKKKGNPYIVHELSHSDFFTIKQMTTNLGLKLDLIKISSVKAWRIEKSCPEIFQFKTSYTQTSYERLDVTKKTKSRKPKELPELYPLYSNSIPIKPNKKSDLLSLTANNHIPKIYSSFFESLV
ncbi:hypothetical protein V9T40_008429 [Parthenolecanium corni]|uniref:DUF7869 domain-containing protein n=1 Tax=Parthenolecanium corni TaxID=536013 RepID=A0AAN9TN42_9HEMI